MSILTGKHILMIGDETEQISRVEAALITYGATITTTTCETATIDKIATQEVDLILLNLLPEGSDCRTMLQTLQQASLDKTIPVFVLVQNDQLHINEAFMLGAADYLTPDEEPHEVLEKMKALFGEGVLGVSASAIDITPMQASGGDSIRVFAVEDDPLLRNLLAARFEKSNLPFELAEDGDQVVEKIKAFKAQVVILDLMLPGKDGFAILEELREAQVDVPVVVFSNKDSQTDRERAKELGAVAFYVKAMTELAELITVIEKYAKR